MTSKSSQNRGQEDSCELTGQKLGLPASLEDGKAPLMFDRFSLIASGLIFAAILWAAVAEIREYASAGGKVVPSGSVKLVHHLEGGQIEKVLVEEGELVEKGQLLVRLRPHAAKAELGQVRVRRSHLLLQKRRLEALTAGRTPDFGVLGQEYPKLAAAEIERFWAERKLRAKELRGLEARIAQKQAEVKAFGLEHNSLKKQVAIQQEQLSIREQLLKSKYVSKRAFLESKAALESVKAQEISIAGKLHAAKEQLVEAKSLYDQAKSQALGTYSDEHSKVVGEIAELDQSIHKHQDRVDRLAVRASDRGIVQELVHKTIGEVVKPGDLVARIVPHEENVVVEVRIEPKDIGHVKIGHQAEIKISTFDPNVFGVLDGKVTRLSATTFQNEDGTSYYKGIIALSKNYVGRTDHRIAILPGMEVQAEIVTGAKSLVKYFLKPVYRSLGTAFSER